MLELGRYKISYVLDNVYCYTYTNTLDTYHTLQEKGAKEIYIYDQKDNVQIL